MKLDGSRLRLAASDLANHLGCRHLTNLNRLVATGTLKVPTWLDPSVKVMAERWLEHERQYLEHLKSSGLNVVEVGNGADAVAVELRSLRQGNQHTLVGASPFEGAGLWY